MITLYLFVTLTKKSSMLGMHVCYLHTQLNHRVIPPSKLNLLSCMELLQTPWPESDGSLMQSQAMSADKLATHTISMLHQCSKLNLLRGKHFPILSYNNLDLVLTGLKCNTLWSLHLSYLRKQFEYTISPTKLKLLYRNHLSIFIKNAHYDVHVVTKPYHWQSLHLSKYF